MKEYKIYTVSKVVSLYTVEADSHEDAEERFDAGEAVYSHEVSDGSAGFVDSEEEIIKIA